MIKSVMAWWNWNQSRFQRNGQDAMRGVVLVIVVTLATVIYHWTTGNWWFDQLTNFVQKGNS